MIDFSYRLKWQISLPFNFHILRRVKSYPFIHNTWCLKKIPLSGGAFPGVYAIIGSTPPPPQNQKKQFPQEIINNKIIFLRILAKKIYMPLEGKKKDFHLNYMFKKTVLHVLKSPPPPPLPNTFLMIHPLIIFLNRQNNNFARAPCFLVHFLAVPARPRREISSMQRILEDVNTQRRMFLYFLSLSLAVVPRI